MEKIKIKVKSGEYEISSPVENGYMTLEEINKVFELKFTEENYYDFKKKYENLYKEISKIEGEDYYYYVNNMERLYSLIKELYDGEYKGIDYCENLNKIFNLDFLKNEDRDFIDFFYQRQLINEFERLFYEML